MKAFRHDRDHDGPHAQNYETLETTAAVGLLLIHCLALFTTAWRMIKVRQHWPSGPSFSASKFGWLGQKARRRQGP